MEVGIGLPATVPGVTGEQLVDWARRAEGHGFSSLGTIDRIVYPNYEPLVALAAAAAVTERIRLTTDILIVPYRTPAVLLAKQAATIHHLSGGRLVLGVAIGARPDDYEAAGVPLKGRARRFEEMLREMRRVWSGESYGFAGGIGPELESPPKLVVGGTVDASFRRAVELGDGWTMGGGTPDQFKESAEKVRAAWREAGRDGEPRLIALAYYSLGEDAEAAAERYLNSYYGFLGDELAGQIAASAATDPETVQGYAKAFADAGADEFILFPSSSDPAQVDLLADVVL